MTFEDVTPAAPSAPVSVGLRHLDQGKEIYLMQEIREEIEVLEVDLSNLKRLTSRMTAVCQKGKVFNTFNYVPGPSFSFKKKTKICV